MGAKKGGGQKVNVTDYFLSWHIGVCYTVDSVLEVLFGEKLLWSGDATANTRIAINDADFFGGFQKEGGAFGSLDVLLGTAAQVLPDRLAARFGLSTGSTGLTVPGFRGLTSLFFSGDGGRGQYARDGFYVGSNNYQVKTVWARVKRIPTTLSPTNSVIPITDDNGGTRYNANFAHMIYDCLTNEDWGMGAASGLVDADSFTDAAAVLKDEGYSGSFLWAQQGTVEGVIGDLCDHIQAVVYVDPATGKFKIKLLRDDYRDSNSPASLEFNASNCVIRNFQRRGLGETINEISVTWTNPLTEEDGVVTWQDLGNITAQGGIVHDDRNYYIFRDSATAMMACVRDVRQSAAPLATCELITNHKAWNVVPGQVILLTYPEHNINAVYFRVGNVKYGKKSSDPAITLSLTEDIFAFAPSSYITQPITEWNNTRETPAPAEFTYGFSAPYLFAFDARPTIGADPDTVPMIFGAQSGQDTYGFTLVGPVQDILGGTVDENLGIKSLVRRGLLTVPLVAEAHTAEFTMPVLTQGAGPDIGYFVFIGDDEDADQEIALIEEADDSNSAGLSWRLRRGVLDTTPKAWAAGTPIWITSVDETTEDFTVHAGGETVTYHLLTKTSRGTLALADAPPFDLDLIDRPQLPSRPANVKINGAAFPSGTVDATALDPIPMTWALRNRLDEDVSVLSWDDAGVTPETGQTVSLIVYDILGAQLNRLDAVTTPYNLAHADLTGAPIVDVKVIAVRDGLDSLQGYTARIQVDTLGYGKGYGYSYGSG